MPAIPDDYPDGNGSGPQAQVMPERVIYHLLKGAFETAKTDQEFIDRMFRLLSAAERATIKAFLNQRPPQIVHAFARRAQKIPLIAVAVQDDREGQQFIDEFMADDLVDPYDESANGVQTLHGGIITTTVQVMIWSDSPDTVQYLYQLAWAFLKAATQTFAGLQMSPVSMSGGDVAPNEDLMPGTIYGRHITIGLEGPRVYTIDGAFWTKVLVAANLISV